jgi:hypothetical protein
MRLKLVIGSAIGVLALLVGMVSIAVAGTSDKAAAPDPLAALRTSTDQFHSIATAEQHGYALLTDAKGIACIDMPVMPGMAAGGMGVHWANSKLVDDPAIIPNQPEAVVYAPMPDGTLQLAAVEYVVIKKAWDATHNAPPKLFGTTFNFTGAPNRYGLPPFYSLHAWAWEHNPAGTFAMWNPRVVCPAT